MKEIRLLVEDKNLKSVLSVVNSLSDELVNDVKVIDKNVYTQPKEPSSSKVVEEDEDYKVKREKLYSFASATIVFLTIAAVYFEFYDKTYVPPFLRFILAGYWFYSLVGIIVSIKGDDYWVDKLYFNVTK